MAQIHVNDLTFYYDGSYDNVFEHVSFSIDTNWKLGFIGRNGKGKTTFLKLLMGQYTYNGSIDTNIVFDYFPYLITKEQMQLPAAEFMEEIKVGCEGWRVICELSKLDEDAEILYRPFVILSPGERTKVLLAVLFSGENEFLLIDEPTNHLDQNARKSVKTYLASKKGFILVSHDRDLLDACIDHCLVLNRKSIEVQSGNFSSWWENKQRKDQFAMAENEKHQKEIRKLRQASQRVSDWAEQSERSKIGFDPVKEHDRSMNTRAYIGAKTKKMQSRVKQMEKRIDREIEEKEGLLQDLESPVDLKLIQLTHYKNTLVHVKDYALQYPDTVSPVFEGLTFTIHKGDRIALTGKNGCGKSTLLKRILQKNAQLQEEFSVIESGVCQVASGLVISYVGQDSTALHGDIPNFCSNHNLDHSLFCTILRQLDFEKYDIFLTCNYLNLRGEKSKERDETIEYELKLLGVENPNEILTRIKKFLPENMKLVKAEPRIITDIYFDTENLSLLNNNASFRLRRQKKSGGWIACFKKPNDMGIVLSRNKFQTTLRASDIHSYDTSPLSGIAYCKAQEFLKKYNDGNLLKPYILVIEYRDRYVLRIGETKTDSSREEKHYDMKRREFMHIIFDFVSVYDLTKMNNDEFLHLIDYGELDYTNKVLKFKTFYTTEIEPNTRKDVKSLSMKIFGQICEVVKELGEITNLSKYALGMDVVGNE